MILGPLQFDRPAWLLIAPALWILSWLIARRSITGLDRKMRIAALLVRSLVFAALVAALAEPSWRDEAEQVSVMLVADVSESIPAQTHVAVKGFLEAATTGARSSDRLGAFTTAAEPAAQILPNPRLAPSTVAQELDADRWRMGKRDATDLAAGVRLALAARPDDTATRLLLVSDGNETQGSVLSAAQSARSAGVPIDVLLVPRGSHPEVIFDDLVVPAAARRGQTVNLRFVLTATKATTGRLSLQMGGRFVDISPGTPDPWDQITLDRGKNVIALPLRLERSGPQVFEAIFEPDDPADDTISQNNLALAVSFVSGEGKVVVYANDHASVAPLFDALVTSEIESELRYPVESFENLTELQQYDAVILFDVPAADFTQHQQELLHAFVHDTGGGLIMIGGPDSFGAGGWIGSPVAQVLPVKLDPPQRRQMPRGALALVLDASGSMAMPVAGTNITQSQAANEAAIAAVRSLSRLDLVGAIAFDSFSRVALPLGPNDDPKAIARRIRSIGPGGGTNMFPAIRKAFEMLRDAPASAKHIIVLSDGQTMDDGSLLQLIPALNEHKITLSTVSIGDGSNDPLMQRLAGATGGSWYSVNSAGGLARLPQIFIKEAQIIRRSLIWEGAPVPVQISDYTAEPMRGISSSLPPVSGYVVTAPREGLALTTIIGPQNDPICAQWQYGLGRAVAFTSDSASRWSSDWVSWGQFRAFWDQHVRWAMRPNGSANVSVVTRSSGDTTHLIVSALDAAGDPLNFARFRGRATGPDLDARSVELRQTGPGRYEAAIPTAQSGTYLISMAYRAKNPDGTDDSGTIQAAVTRSFSDEHRALRDNTALLRQVAQLTGGRVIDPQAAAPPDLFSRTGLTMPVAKSPIWLAMALAGAGLFLVDVGIRRVRIDVRAMVRAVSKAAHRAEATAHPDLGGLQAVRAKARSRLAPSPALATQRDEMKVQATFEADDHEIDSAEGLPIVVVDPKPAIDAHRPSVDAQSEDEGAGLSRLLKAKRRAQQAMDDQAPVDS